MPVYIIRAGEFGPVKIGYADNVELRLTKMQSDNHERLTLIGLFDGGTYEERCLHGQFAQLKLHGEWYAFSKQMAGDLGLQRLTLDQADALRAWAWEMSAGVPIPAPADAAFEAAA